MFKKVRLRGNNHGTLQINFSLSVVWVVLNFIDFYFTSPMLVSYNYVWGYKFNCECYK